LFMIDSIVEVRSRGQAGVRVALEKQVKKSWYRISRGALYDMIVDISARSYR
jgi:hypothetical protein